MKPSVLFALLLFSVGFGPQAEAAEQAPFRVGAVVDGTTFFRHETPRRNGGALRYYLSGTPAAPKPLLVYLQGSGCQPLFEKRGESLVATAGQDIVAQMAAGRFAILVVEKPRVESEGEARGGGTTEQCTADFNREHSLDSWTGTVSDAIRTALRNPAVQRHAGVRVIGLSEGAIVAARLAATEPKISQVGFISGFGCDQWRDMLVVARRNATPATAPQAISQTEDGLRAVASDPGAVDRLFMGQTHLFWSTFGRACPARDLVSSRAQVFVAFGTADEQIDANSIEAIPAAFIAAGRPIRVHRVLGGSHTLDVEGTPPFSNLLKVFGEMLDWMAEPTSR